MFRLLGLGFGCCCTCFAKNAKKKKQQKEREVFRGKSGKSGENEAINTNYRTHAAAASPRRHSAGGQRHRVFAFRAVVLAAFFDGQWLPNALTVKGFSLDRVGEAARVP